MYSQECEEEVNTCVCLSPNAMPSLILNETTLFYLNLSTITNTTNSSFNKVKNWTSHVAKARHITRPSSAHVGSSKSSVPSKRTTSSTSAIVKTDSTLLQPERKKIKLDNHDLTTSGFLEDEDDETIEREAAISSPVKGNQRLNSKVCHISHHDQILTCRQTIVKVENLSPLPKRSGANRKYTNADLPNGAMNNNTWRKIVIPTYIQYLAGQDSKETWSIDDKESTTLLQAIWNFTYGAEVPHFIRVNGPAFSIVSSFPACPQH
jgi:hypothetical protein